MPKYNRWNLTRAEKNVLLHTFYTETHFPDRTTLSSLAMILGRKERQIKVWFQNQRQRQFVWHPGEFEM